MGRIEQHVVIIEAGREALQEHVRDGNYWPASALRQRLSPAERGVLQISAGLLEQVAAAETVVDRPAHRASADT